MCNTGAIIHINYTLLQVINGFVRAFMTYKAINGLALINMLLYHTNQTKNFALKMQDD